MQLRTQAALGITELIDLALPQIAIKLAEQGLKLASQDYTLDCQGGEATSVESFILTFQCVGLAPVPAKKKAVAPQPPASVPVSVPDTTEAVAEKTPMPVSDRIAKMNAARLAKRAEKQQAEAAATETPNEKEPSEIKPEVVAPASDTFRAGSGNHTSAATSASAAA